ncbi:MAG: hypothetical protein DRO73_04345 [Candidatus Thorarchaeota archaeon]|nr:MAG: hypothetical protein DRO73_04345 [Candidatus Thorarchaeota archaeon]
MQRLTLASQRNILIGAVAPLVALLCIVIAIAISPWFSWLDNALSDLGNYNNGMLAAVIFNAGLITTGAMLFVFLMRLMGRVHDTLTGVGLAIFLISVAFLTLIGVFSENAGRIHFWVSVGFFFTFPFAMWAVGLSWLRFAHLRWFAVLSILLPFVSLCLWPVTFGGTAPWTGVAIPEILTALTAIVWIWLFQLLLVRNKLEGIVST